MRSYVQKSEKTSRTLEGTPKASRQPSIKEILQTYRSTPPQKPDAIPVLSKQQGQYGVLQRNMIPEVLLSLETPIFQLKNTTACWFLSLLYGIHQAGWVKDLFDHDVIRIEKQNNDLYICEKEGQTVNVTFVKDGRPLWQQILEAFIEQDNNIMSYLKGKTGEAFQKRIKGIGLGSNAIRREDMKLAITTLLGAICNKWNVLAFKSISIPGMIGATSPLKEMVGQNYLTPRETPTQQTLEVIAVEKKDHAMSVKAANFSTKAMFSTSVKGKNKSQSVPDGVKISNIQIYNQYAGINQSKEYNDISPEKSDQAKAKEKTTAKNWWQPLNYMSYLKLARPQHLNTVNALRAEPAAPPIMTDIPDIPDMQEPIVINAPRVEPAEPAEPAAPAAPLIMTDIPDMQEPIVINAPRVEPAEPAEPLIMTDIPDIPDMQEPIVINALQD